MTSTVEPDANAQTDATDEPGGAGFWIGAVIGLGIMAFGIKGLFDAAPSTRPDQVGVGLVGLDLLHDAIVAPIVCVIGLLLTRFLPRALRAPVRAGLFASAIVIVVGWAALRGYGRDSVPDNPTVDPLHYGTAVLTVLGVVWGLAALWAVVAAWRAGARSRMTTSEPVGTQRESTGT